MADIGDTAGGLVQVRHGQASGDCCGCELLGDPGPCEPVAMAAVAIQLAVHSAQGRRRSSDPTRHNHESGPTVSAEHKNEGLTIHVSQVSTCRPDIQRAGGHGQSYRAGGSLQRNQIHI